MSALTTGQQATLRRARDVLTDSRQLPPTASDNDRARTLGRLEIALEQALRLIDELTGGS
ncbi:hypothetical protein [Streptomyces sp. NPDC127040]|uniref:hypothetical protein n=1 Tax=Streptomyces sp. NPDC127040 TaxID=3347116 RepID=UPI0036495843